MFRIDSLYDQLLYFPVPFRLCFPVQLVGMHWVSCSSVCLVYKVLMLLFLYMTVGNDLLTYFVVLALGYMIEELKGIVSVYDWESHLVRGLYLVPVYRWLALLVWQ